MGFCAPALSLGFLVLYMLWALTEHLAEEDVTQ